LGDCDGDERDAAVAFSNYLNQIVPLTKLEGQLAAVAMIGVATVVNVLGTRRSTDLNNWATWTKLIAICRDERGAPDFGAADGGTEGRAPPRS